MIGCISLIIPPMIGDAFAPFPCPHCSVASHSTIFVSGILALTSLAAVAAPELHITLPLEPAKLDISNRFSVATDPSITKTIADRATAEFKPRNGVFVAGYSANIHWLKFTVSDPAARTRERWLELGVWAAEGV